ncbi:MAG TPA: HAD-IA family hydrolase [Burkholderiales bacterium]|nr:HAD-IA family hydrolase [Burkholderiales bacterium]
MRYPLLVFDWDGTLIDSAPTIVACIQAACRDLGLPVPEDARASHVIGLGLHDALSYAVPGLPSDEHGRMVERYRKHFLARDPEIPLFPGTRAMLAGLRDRGHVLAIATGKSRAGLTRALDNTGLRPLFAASRCADECASKPAPDMLCELIEELGTNAVNTLMIGDTVHDLQMAAHAGVGAVAVSHGAHPRDALVTLAPIACVENIDELTRWLAQNA